MFVISSVFSTFQFMESINMAPERFIYFLLNLLDSSVWLIYLFTYNLIVRWMIENRSKIKEFCTIHREFVLRVCLTLPRIKFYLFKAKEINIDYTFFYFDAKIRYRRLLLVVCLVLTYCWLDGILCKKFYFNAYRRLFYAKVLFYFVTCHRLLYAKIFLFYF